MPEYRSDHVAKSPLTMPDRARKTLHLPAKPAAASAPKPAQKAAPAKPRVSPEEQRAREAADQAAKRIRIAALSKDAEALKISLIDRYPHLFAVDPPRPLASGIHRVLAEQTGAPIPVLKLALAKLTRRNAYLGSEHESALRVRLVRTDSEYQAASSENRSRNGLSRSGVGWVLS